MIHYKEAHYGRQVLGGLLDASLVLGVVSVLVVFQKPNGLFYYLLESMNSSLLALLIFGFYRLFALFFFGRTLGMKLFRLRLLNGEEQPLRPLEKLLAAFFILFRGTGYYQIQ
jgi:uncharacterized RDD family membrane protein YckC